MRCSNAIPRPVFETQLVADLGDAKHVPKGVLLEINGETVGFGHIATQDQHFCNWSAAVSLESEGYGRSTPCHSSRANHYASIAAGSCWVLLVLVLLVLVVGCRHFFLSSRETQRPTAPARGFLERGEASARRTPLRRFCRSSMVPRNIERPMTSSTCQREERLEQMGGDVWHRG